MVDSLVLLDKSSVVLGCSIQNRRSIDSRRAGRGTGTGVDIEWIEQVLAGQAGRRPARASRQLELAFAKGRYDAQIAANRYGLALDETVWDFIKGLPLSRPVYAQYLDSAARERTIDRLVEQFQRDLGARKRPVLRGLLRYSFGA